MKNICLTINHYNKKEVLKVPGTLKKINCFSFYQIKELEKLKKVPFLKALKSVKNTGVK